MDSNPTRTNRTEATTIFETELEQLVTTAFARGASIEATWEIATPVSDAPDWLVTVEKRPTKTNGEFEPQFLEE
ncbi:hypothetical protein [Natrialba sp. INN-245]|uniref:hypothetical protein n=1 Tax=Natrialba sp. INN-245 TaxID=2690967 RepID=UPI001313593E|nr:hypothetical protein [Natrialba sp. INN-245]MWV39511.1 hypothetical protein [Natrialba sp. INN-245]